MIYFCCAFLSLVFLPFCLCRQSEGNPCTITINDTTTTTQVPGICQSLYNCPHAVKVLYTDEKKLPVAMMCRWRGDLRIVCCPTMDLGHRTGLFGKLYEPSKNGIKESNVTSCYYDGTQQLCCPRKPDVPLPAETGCPALDIPVQPPNLSISEGIAWQKCMENQRFVQVCVAETGDKDRLKREEVCYIPKEKFRISGGKAANENEFPYMAVLGLAEVIEKGSIHDVRWVGGGSLISDRYILTAAHVLIDAEGRPLRYAKLGGLNKTDVRDGVLYTIVHTLKHHLYDYSTQKHDIALLKLHTRVQLSVHIRPICLPVRGYHTHDSIRAIAGWGEMNENSQSSQVLLTTDVRIVACNSEHYDPSIMICAKGEIRNSGISDSCHGDSGGPLMAYIQNVPCSQAVEGVVSFGPRCGEGAHGMYTRVPYYLDWIVQTVWPKEWERANQNSEILKFLEHEIAEYTQ